MSAKVSEHMLREYFAEVKGISGVDFDKAVESDFKEIVIASSANFGIEMTARFLQDLADNQFGESIDQAELFLKIVNLLDKTVLVGESFRDFIRREHLNSMRGTYSMLVQDNLRKKMQQD